MPKLPSSSHLLPRLVLLLVCTAGLSCWNNRDNTADGNLRVESDGDDFPKTITDQLGRKTRLEREPERIISLAPAHTEILFAIGAGDKVVGVTAYCNYPPEAAECEKVGGFAGHEISVERIISLRPDVVFSSGGYHTQLIEQLAKLDIPAIALEPTSFGEIYKTIELLGHATGHTKQAKQVVRETQARVEAVQDAIGDDSHRPTVLYVVQAQPLMTVGSRSFISELIRLAGGRNIFDDVDADYPAINQEAVISRDPEIIVLPSHGTEYGDLDQLTKRAGWESLRAVTGGRVYKVDGDLMVRTSPRIVEGLEHLAAKLFPERFAPKQADSKRSAAEVQPQ